MERSLRGFMLSEPQLSPFEQSLQPRRVIVPVDADPSNDFITLDTKLINESFTNEIVCAICMDVIDTTWTVMACLHRFCSGCLQKCLRMERGGNQSHECPLCRAKLASRRSCKADPLYDRLIATLMSRSIDADNSFSSSSSSGGGNSTEVAEARVSQSTCGKAAGSSSSNIATSPNPLIPWSSGLSRLDIAQSRKTHFENIQMFRKRQRDGRIAGLLGSPRDGAGRESGGSVWGGGAEDDSASSRKGRLEDLKVNIGLHPVPLHDTHRLRKPFLTLPGHAKVSDVKDYLLLKMQTSCSSFVLCSKIVDNIASDEGQAGKIQALAASRDLVDIYIADGARPEALLADGEALCDVAAERWDAASELSLYYRLPL